MRSCLRPARKSALILTSTLLLGGLSACASRPVTILNARPCSALIPDSWRAGVPAPSLPAVATAGEWAAYADAAAGQLDKANGRTADVIGIVRACEARDAEAVERIGRPWWARLRPG